jgi:hypothetical protein
MTGSNELLIVSILCVMGLLAFFKPILLYRGMKRGGEGVSPLNLFIMGAVYIVLSILVIKLYYQRNPLSLAFSIVLFLLGLWNIWFGILVRKLEKTEDNDDDSKPDNAQ